MLYLNVFIYYCYCRMIAHKLAEDPLYHTVVIKDKQRFWKRILIIDDEVEKILPKKREWYEFNRESELERGRKYRQCYIQFIYSRHSYSYENCKCTTTVIYTVNQV